MEIALPALPSRSGTCFVEVARRRGDYALLGVAAVVTLGSDGVCTAAGLALCNAGPTPVRATKAAAALVGRRVGEREIRDAAAAAAGEIDPPGNVHATRGVPASSGRGIDAASAGGGGGEGGAAMSGERVLIATTVNGTRHERAVEPRMLLSDFIRHELGLTGTHVGCEHGVCGACTILVDGLPVRACLMFAPQANGCAIETVEGLAPDRTKLHPLQEAFRDAHGLQCGYCTPGILMTMKAFLAEHPSPSEAEVREALSGNLCRCTGYQHIVDAVMLAAKRVARR